MFKKIINNDYFLSFISKFFVMLFGFVSLIFLNRYLGAELKGRYSSLINIVTILSAILQLGIQSVYPKFKRKHINNCYEIFISLSIIQFIIYFLFFTAVSIICRDASVTLICIITPISIITTQFRYINLVENIKKNTLVVFLMSATNSVLTIAAFVLLERNLNIAFAIYAIKDLVIILLYSTKINYSSLFKREYISHYWNILKEGFLPMLSGLLIMLNYKLDIIMLNAYSVSFTDIGIYALGLSIAEYVWVIPDIFKDVVQKRTAKSNSLDTINFSLRCSTTCVLTVFIVLAVLNKRLFVLLFGEEFIEAYNITMLLMIGVYSMIYYKVIGQLFISDDKSKQYFLALLIGAIINIIINALIIPSFGIYGAAIASIASYSGIGVIFLTLYLRQYNVKLKETLIIRKKDISKLANYFRRKK